MLGSSIVLTAPQPRGVFLEGTISDTSATLYPGAAAEIVAVALPGNTNFVGGEPLWERYGKAAGMADADPRLCAILYENQQGGIFSTPYNNGDRCFLYCPLAGEYMNILVAPQAGTSSANAYSVGERLIPKSTIVSSTGGAFVIESTSSVQAWFMSMEHYDAPADAVGWLWAQRQF